MTSTLPLHHTAYFYRDESVLHRAIAQFFAEGARHGDSLIMISRAGTFEAVLARLGNEGDPVDRDGIHFVEAASALAQFMDNDRPDTDKFQEGIASLLTGVRSGSNKVVRLFGEMVDVLSADGNHEGAVCLEETWNRIALAYEPVSVLCGYQIGNFENDPNAVRYHAVCNQHSFIVPADDHSEQSSPVPILREEPSRKERLLRSEATIYVIEDDDSVRRSLARLLGSMNLKVQTYGSAEEFLLHVGDSPKGCVIVDVQLVGMSGAELQNILIESGCPLPVIAMSGSHDPQIEINALRLGAKAFLCKPFNLHRLLEAIDQAME